MSFLDFIKRQVEEESGDLSCLEVRMGDRASGKVVGQVSNEGSLNSGKGVEGNDYVTCWV